MNRTNLVYKQEGEPTGGFTMDFAYAVYKSCPIFQHRPYLEFYLSTKSLIEETARWEYTVFVEDDEAGTSNELLASMCYFEEYDMHVGKCLSVLVAMSLHNGLLNAGYKSLITTARKNNISYVCYTKALGEADRRNMKDGTNEVKQDMNTFEYRLVYRKLQRRKDD